MNTSSDALALLQCALENFGVHIHIRHFSAGARSTVRSVDANLLFELVNRNSISRIARRRYHWSNSI
jgi:hypothetical protein